MLLLTALGLPCALTCRDVSCHDAVAGFTRSLCSQAFLLVAARPKYRDTKQFKTPRFNRPTLLARKSIPWCQVRVRLFFGAAAFWRVLLGRLRMVRRGCADEHDRKYGNRNEGERDRLVPGLGVKSILSRHCQEFQIIVFYRVEFAMNLSHGANTADFDVAVMRDGDCASEPLG